MIVSLKFIKLTGLSVSKFSKKQFYSQKLAYHAHLEVLSLVKNILRMLDIMLYGTLVKRGWYNEHPSTINLKCNEIFTGGLPKKVKDFANKCLFKHISSSLEPSIPFHSLFNMVDSEHITLGKTNCDTYSRNCYSIR